MKIGIIGAGNLGLALAASLAGNDNHQISIGSRNVAEKQSEITNIPELKRPNIRLESQTQAAASAELVIFTVPDDHIRKTATELLPSVGSNTVLAHCSGSLSSETLPASHKRCSAHPLNTFPNPLTAIACLQRSDHGTALVCEGDDTALKKVASVFELAGFEFLKIDVTSKALYHAASVMACNYLSVLMNMSLRTAELSGLQADIFWRAAQPLITATLNNIDLVGAPNSLSGPVVRGDVDTVSKHLQLLDQLDPELAKSYRALGEGALNITKERGQLTTEQINSLEQMLSTPK